MDKLLLVYITASCKDEAVSIARQLVELRLAACVNIVDNLTSIYRWDGKILEDKEVLLLAKTKIGSFDKLKNMVIKLHSYDNPCVVAMPVTNASLNFEKWVISETDQD